MATMALKTPVRVLSQDIIWVLAADGSPFGSLVVLFDLDADDEGTSEPGEIDNSRLWDRFE